MRLLHQESLMKRIGLLAPRGRRSLALLLLLALALLGTAFVGSTRMVTLCMTGREYVCHEH